MAPTKRSPKTPKAAKKRRNSKRVSHDEVKNNNATSPSCEKTTITAHHNQKKNNSIMPSSSSKDQKYYRFNSVEAYRHARDGSIEYLIEWNDKTKSWEPESNLNSAALDEATKFSLLENLEDNSKTEIRSSNIHGVGVFANEPIPKNATLFQFHCKPTYETVDFTPAEIEALSNIAKGMVKKFFVKENNNFPIPKHGIACALGISFYINSCKTKGCETEANLKFGTKNDLSGYKEIIATRNINRDEELLLPYNYDD